MSSSSSSAPAADTTVHSTPSSSSNPPHPSSSSSSKSPKITPFLWFNNNLEEALEFYNAIFNNTNYKNYKKKNNDDDDDDNKSDKPASTPSSSSPASFTTRLIRSPQNGDVVCATFTLAGQRFMALNGGPHFQFNEAISLFISCGDDQDEVDYYWDKLLEGGGAPSQCGWLKDKFGVSWQVIPDALERYLGDEDRERSGRAMEAMHGMTKIIVKDLEKAWMGEQQPGVKE